MTISPAESFLSSVKLLRRYYDGDLNALINTEELKSILFLELRSENSDKPDYFYKNIRDLFFESACQDSVRGYIIKSFKEIYERFVYFRTNRIYIESDLFEKWQNLITKLPPLPIIAFSIYDKCRIYDKFKQSSEYDEGKLVAEILKNSSLPSIYEPEVEDFIFKEGLSEIHLHLSGTSETDFVWQDALLHPAKFYRHIKQLSKSDKKAEMSEQYMQLGDFKYDDVFGLVKTASSIRNRLISFIDKYRYGNIGVYLNNDKDKCSPFNPQFTNNIKRKPLLFADKIHPYRKIYINKAFFSISDAGIGNQTNKKLKSDLIGDKANITLNCSVNGFAEFNAIQYEALFLIKAFQYLEYYKDYEFARLFHYYLLIYSFCNRLLAQQKDQTGFEQFLKIADNKLREFSEEKYVQRFKQLRGMYGQDLARLEGRFTPKKGVKKNLKILRSIIKDYETVKNGCNGVLRYDLSLVAHFIKEKDKTKLEIAPYRDIKLRTKTEKNLRALNCSLHYIGNRDKYFCGFDAANNEMFARPEVFAPAFRRARFMGFNCFTFHAGEDFTHLLSGIRAVYEAMDFLELSVGDRIGHATALGIEPAMWLERTGKISIMEKGEWLDDMVFACFLINSNNLNFSNRAMLSERINELFFEIYSEEFKKDPCVYDRVRDFEILDMINAWKLRKLDPGLSFGTMHNSLFDEFTNEELKNIFKYKYEKKYYDTDLEKDIDLLKIYKKANLNFYGEKKDFRIFRAYHSGKTIKESKKLIEVKTSDIFDEDIFRIFQDIVINKLTDKRIAVEALPTSNLRISFYKNYSEHHIFRWLGIDKESRKESCNGSNGERNNDKYTKPIVCLGSDDAGIFSTNARNEFSHIFCSLIAKGIDRKQALDVIKEIAENNRIYGFRCRTRLAF